MTRPPFDPSVYLVTDPDLCAGRGVVETVRRAVAGGATLVQLRDKQADDATLIQAGRAIKAALDGSGVPLIVNDRLDVARAIGADGLHLGQNDGDPAAVRAALPATALLGLSIEHADQARGIDPTVIDYVGAGPVRATATKPGHAPPIGWAGLARICARSPVPVVAIGGLTVADAGAALAAGAAGLAVVSAICAAADPTAAARDLTQAVTEARR